MKNKIFRMKWREFGSIVFVFVCANNFDSVMSSRNGINAQAAEIAPFWSQISRQRRKALTGTMYAKPDECEGRDESAASNKGHIEQIMIRMQILTIFKTII